MIFNEQFYYHESPFDTLDKSKARFNCTFLTNNYRYALEYSKKDNGKIGYLYKITFKSSLNIFNIRHVLDDFKLNKHCDTKLYQFAHTSNWFSDSDLRNKLLKNIFRLGYDGFFDFESDKFDNPSIGVFDSNNLTVLEKLDLRNIRKEFSDLYESDLNNVQFWASQLYNSGYKELDLISDLIFLDKSLTLEKPDILKGIDLSKSKLSENKINFDKIGRPYALRNNIKRDYILNLKTFLRLKENDNTDKSNNC